MYFNPEILPDLGERELQVFLVSCHNDGNIEGRALVRREMILRGMQMATIYFDVQTSDNPAAIGGRYYPELIPYAPGSDICRHCASDQIVEVSKNDGGNIGLKLVCVTCGSHGYHHPC